MRCAAGLHTRALHRRPQAMLRKRACHHAGQLWQPRERRGVSQSSSTALTGCSRQRCAQQLGQEEGGRALRFDVLLRTALSGCGECKVQRACGGHERCTFITRMNVAFMRIMKMHRP